MHQEQKDKSQDSDYNKSRGQQAKLCALRQHGVYYIIVNQTRGYKLKTVQALLQIYADDDCMDLNLFNFFQVIT